jgi:hypothetical protein
MIYIGTRNMACNLLLVWRNIYNHVLERNTMKKILGFLATACLALGANTASAIPFQVNVISGGVGGAGGTWELNGPTDKSGAWGGIIIGLQSWSFDIAPGTYDWSIDGIGIGFPAGASWSLYMAGNQIYQNDVLGFFKFKIYDDHTFTAVPEPGTLGLLGLGLWAAGFAATRRRKGKTSEQLA